MINIPEKREIKIISLLKSYIFATYKTNPKKFKFRNRILLLMFIIIITNIIYKITEKEEKEIILEEHKIKKINMFNENSLKEKEKVNLNEIKEILYKEEIEENKYLEISEKEYFIQIAAIYKLDLYEENFNKLKENNLNYIIKEYNTKKGDILKKILVGPYNSYEEANSKVNEINNLLKVKSFIRNFEKGE